MGQFSVGDIILRNESKYRKNKKTVFFQSNRCLPTFPNRFVGQRHAGLPYLGEASPGLDCQKVEMTDGKLMNLLANPGRNATIHWVGVRKVFFHNYAPRCSIVGGSEFEIVAQKTRLMREETLVRRQRKQITKGHRLTNCARPLSRGR